MTPRPWPLLLALAACIKENPAYKDGSTGADTGAGTGGPDVTGSAGTDAPTTDGGGDGTTTSAASTGGAETTAAETTAESTSDDATTGAGCIPDPNEADCSLRSVNGHNYLLCEELVGWSAARDGCTKRCATLVIFSDSTPDANPESLALAADLRMLMSPADHMDEQEILDEEYAQQDSQHASWWIGGNRREDDQWYWLDDTPMPGHAMGGWNPDDPDTSPDSDQQCAALAVYGAAADDGKWFDRACDSLYRYLCERP